jgi:RNA polymerase sigma-54 factor
MDLKQEISTRLEQRLRLTPEITQAIRLLQLSRLELQETVEEEMKENPVLEQEYSEDGVSSLTPATDESNGARNDTESLVPREEEDIKDLRGLMEQWETFSSTPSNNLRQPDDELPPLENRVHRGPTLYEHLEWQLSMSPLHGRHKDVAVLILEAINSEGYVDLQSLVEIAERTGVPQEEVTEVLYAVQQFDPAGIASVTLRDCLLVQARELYPDHKRLHAIVEYHLPDVEEHRYDRIFKALGCTSAELKELLRLLATLDPHPGLQFGGEEAQFIVPDVYIRKDGDQYVVELNDDGLPRLRMSKQYERLLNGRARGAEADWLKKKWHQAKWLIRSIDQRQSTIRRVAEQIVEFQRDFLDHGLEHLHPMVLRDVANAIGVHESTVSRVTSNKYVHTPRGIFELKFFFGHRIAGTDGADHTQLRIKQMLKEIVAEEPGGKPYSDQRIKELILERHSIDLARRTITKYREELNVPSSSERKKRL